MARRPPEHLEKWTPGYNPRSNSPSHAGPLAREELPPPSPNSSCTGVDTATAVDPRNLPSPLATRLTDRRSLPHLILAQLPLSPPLSGECLITGTTFRARWLRGTHTRIGLRPWDGWAMPCLMVCSCGCLKLLNHLILELVLLCKVDGTMECVCECREDALGVPRAPMGSGLQG